MIANYDFFENESKKYERILLDFYKNPNSQPFVDENFHPCKQIIERKLKFDLNDQSITWKRIDEVFPAPLFKEDLIHPYYINQGQIGDCYFITGLSRVAKQPYLVPTLFEKRKPDIILGEVEDSINLKCGAVIVYFFAFGRKTPVLIDTTIPIKNGDCVFCRPSKVDKSAWFCLVEKAYAKLNGSYSNIEGGYISYPIYSLFGYFQKHINFKEWNSKKTKPLIERIIKYQKFGCIMDSSINSSLDQIMLDDIKNHNLVTGHSYLILKVREVNGNYFFFLRNPWGYKIWNGDYSSGSPLLTYKLKKSLKYRNEHGAFWMIDRDFFHYFTRIGISKPINPKYTVRLCHCTLPEGSNSTLSSKWHLEEKPNFAFQITETVTTNKPIKFYILIEKRRINLDEDNGSTTVITFANANGKKIDSGTLRDPTSFTKKSFGNIFSLSYTLTNPKDIITFVVHNIGKSTVSKECYIRVFCEYNFKLYNIDDPDKHFPRTENFGPVFDNFTITCPEIALPLKEFYDKGKKFLWYDKATPNDLNDQREQRISNIIEDCSKKIDSHHYSNEGAQLNIDLYNYNRTPFQANSSISYTVTDKTGKRKYLAKVIAERSDQITQNFSKELSFVRVLKYPSIVNFIGYSEINFEHEEFPVLITEFYQRGSLYEILKNEANSKLHEKGFDDWNNTKKMICLIGIALGMRYIHKHDIIHRNLKSSNILLDDNLYPKIGDFALSKNAKSTFNQTLMLGKPEIIAPELIGNDQNYSFPVDVFAFSLIAYHIYSIHEPQIPSKSSINLHQNIVNGKRPATCYLPEKYRDFIEEMWNNDQFERPTFDEIVRRLLSEREKLWLENVDEKEVNLYLHQFGLSFGNRRQISKNKKIKSMKNPENAKQPKLSLQQIYSNVSIPIDIKEDIKKADGIDITNPTSFAEIEKNCELLFKVGWEFYMGEKGSYQTFPQDFFYALKYLKLAALLGNKEAICCISTICLLDYTNSSSKETALDLLDILVDDQFVPAANLYGILYKSGDKIEKNIVMSAVYFKIAADLGEPLAMFEYATILRQIFQHEINKEDRIDDINKARIIINKMDGRNNYFYLEARFAIDTVDDEYAALYVAKKYFERASNFAHSEAKIELGKIKDKQKEVNYSFQYYEELCQPIKNNRFLFSY